MILCDKRNTHCESLKFAACAQHNNSKYVDTTLTAQFGDNNSPIDHWQNYMYTVEHTA